MFFGQYDHSIDDKSRLTLPARFRDALADGVVLSKGLDGSVDVYPKAAWNVTVAERIGQLDPLLPDTRTMQRHFFGGASEDTPDKQGRVLLPGPLLRYGKLDQGRHGGRQQRPPRDLGPRRLGGAPGRDRRECRPCCRTSCRTTRLITPPFSPTRCASFSPCSRARPSSTRPSGAGGHARLLAAELHGRGQARRDRPRPEREGAVRPVQGAGGRRRAVPPWRLRGRPLAARRERDQGRRDPARHRRLLDADRPAGARILVRDRRAARHADGPLGRGDGRDDRQHVGRARARDDLPPARGGALRGPDRSRDRPAARGAGVLPHRRSRRRDQDGDPDACPVRRRASCEARLPGTAHRGQRRARPARGCAARSRRDAPARWPARGDQLPLARGPDRQAVHGRPARRDARARRTSRSASAARSPSCGC